MSPNPRVGVRLTGSYPAADIDRLVADLAPVLGLTAEARITVDLRALTFLLPSTTAVLAVALGHALDLGLWGPGSRVLLPRSSDVRNYLGRIELIQAALEESSERNRRRRPSEGFRECQHFADENESHHVARELTDALAERCSMDRVARFALGTALGELCDNVIHHADTSTGGFAAAQGFVRRRRFDVAIADLGIGVLESLSANEAFGSVENHVDAIDAALSLGVTSKPKGSGHVRGHAGYGLAITKALLAANGGNLIVKSGDGEVWAGKTQKRYICDVSFPGTLVIIEARTDRPLDVRQVYDDLLGGFDDDD